MDNDPSGNQNTYSERMTSHALGGQLADAAAHAAAAGGRHGRHLESMTSCKKNLIPSIDAYMYLLEEQSCQISFRSDLKLRRL